MYNISKIKYTNVPDRIMRLTPKEYFERAVELCPEEPSVLEICGQFARYRGELDTSEKLLRNALKIKPTCHAYHHLALTLKGQVESRSYKGQFVNTTKEDRLEKEISQGSRDRSRGSYQRGQERNQQTCDRRTVVYSRSDDHSKGAYNCSLDVDCNKRGGMYNPGQERRFTGVKSRRGGSHKHGNQNKNGQQNKSSRPCTPNQSEGKRLRRMIKSPLTVSFYPENDLLVEAIQLLEKTEELTTEYGLGIEYDKGIIYRMLGQIEKAVKVFKQIVSKKKYLPTKSLMTNVYEQLGLCLLELSKSEEVSPDMQQKYKRDGQAHLQHAVQIQSEIVANDPQFKAAWNSYPTLKELLSDKSVGKPKQLAVLHMLMGDHKDSISIYQKLFRKEEAEMNQEDFINLLECYKRDGQFEKCVAVLKSLECTTIFVGLPPSLIFDVYIDCAFHAYTTDTAQLAYQHFRRAFKVYSMFDKIYEDQTNVDEDADTKDILILHTCSHDWKCKLPRNLGTILEDVTGLRYTINSDDVLPNELLLTSTASIIQKIPFIIIMTHESADSYHPLFVDQAIKRSSEQSGPQVLVVTDDECNMPDIARTKPFIRMPPLLEGAMEPTEQIPEEHQEWVKEFITLLKPK
ncbi:uncharacterized protein LOC110441254 [Mizuhopecten yessoensis]|uniref:uncharacterized protein LOC110441254 n=1 Tax=Mizuhopecten yessoensis TaxID=6573 RepID=UPI000B45CB4A|nr:uncharacterized protein LOC110441254 [Mizuhopecten yessoensis]